MNQKYIIGLVAVVLTICLIPGAVADTVTVTRDLPDNELNSGETFLVTINPTGFFVMGTVEEVLPEGYLFVVGSAQNVDREDYDFSSRTLELQIDSEVTNVTYEVIAGTETGTFTGTYATVDSDANPVLGSITGDDTVIISIPDWREKWLGDGVVTTEELQEVIHYWLDDIPIDGYLLKTSDLQEVISCWLSG